ncbi:MAG: AraC family transcriptional regulator [Candidatus Kapabacteria bacterium]|nr:AraC family transcriptional regulator [Candidatus Kapabacteria bacterium]
MNLYIKNMVCSRCVSAVENILKQLNIPFISVQLGEVKPADEINGEMLQLLESGLNDIGFEIINDKKGRLIEQIKNTIIELVHRPEEHLKINISDFLADKLHYDYNYLSNLFSEIEGTTIEKYYISQKIEKVKELLVYDELSLNEISYQLGYSSAAYLSNQFKKVTGLTPGHFKNIKSVKRIPLDKL